MKIIDKFLSFLGLQRKSNKTVCIPSRIPSHLLGESKFKIIPILTAINLENSGLIYENNKHHLDTHLTRKMCEYLIENNLVNVTQKGNILTAEFKIIQNGI